MEFSNYIQAATGNNAGLQFAFTTPSPGTEGYQVRRVIASPTAVAPLYFEPGIYDGESRSKFLGALNASTSVKENLIPRVG
mgnify:FL=1